jgi:O-antigen ligase
MHRAFSAARFLAPYALLLPALFFSGIFYESYQLPKAFSFLVLALFFTPLAALHRGSPGFLPAEIMMFAYYLFMTGYALFSPYHPPFYYTATAFAPAAFFIFYYSPVRPRAFTMFVSIVLLASLFYAVVQFSQHGIERPYSFFGNPVFAAEFAGALIPFAAAGVLTAGREKHLHYAVLLLFIPAMILFSSRGAVLSFAISSACLLFMLRKQPVKNFFGFKKTAVAVLLIAAVILLLPGFAGSVKNFFSRADSAMDLSSLAVTNRVVMGKAAVSMWKTSPVFGRGFGAYGGLFQKEQAGFLGTHGNHTFIKTSHAHNDYLQLLAETGAAGLFLFLCALFSCVYCFEKNSPYMGKNRFIFTAAALSSVIFLCSASFFNFPLFSMPACFLFFGMCGLLCKNPEPSPRQDKTVFLKSSYAAAIVLALPLVFAITPGIHKKILSDTYLKYALTGPGPEKYYSRASQLDPSGFQALYHHSVYKTSMHDYEGALKLLKQSLFYHPHSADTLYNAGVLLAALGRHSEALQYFNNALSLSPGFDEANSGAFHSLTALGMEEEALKYLVPAASGGRLKEAQEKTGIILREAPADEK